MPHNLPPPRTPFVGRAPELQRLLDLLGDPALPLVTLVGPGGMGKSRLAREAARRLLAQDAQLYTDGIFYVRLAPISEAAHLPQAIADVFGFSWQGDAAAVTQLSTFLRDRRALLLLDNFEHLLEDGLGMIAGLLATAPGLQLCITSRQRLGLLGEATMTIAGLPFSTVDDPLQSDAAQLFLQTARRVRGEMTLQPADSQAVAEICRLTEGMPLALLLAAAWMDTLSPVQIAAEISQDLDFLAAEMADLPPRQRSMRAAYAYTWLLLSSEERIAFARLSVFRGGFSRRAAATVARITLPVLAQLVRKSLVSYDAVADRYYVHELLRQYGAEYLVTGRQTAAARPAAVRKDHSYYYLTAIADRVADLGGIDQNGALRAIAIDYENVRAAWRWAIDHQELALLGEALDGLFYFHYFSGRELEGGALFAQTREKLGAVEASPPPLDDERAYLDARLQNRACELNHLLDGAPLPDVDALRRRFRARNDVAEEALLLNCAARSAIRRRAVGEALGIYHAQFNLWQQLGNRLQQGFCLTNIAQIGILSGQIDLGLGAAQQALDLQQSVGDRLGAGVTHLTLGTYALLWSGEYARAARHFAEAYAVGDETQVAGHLITGVVMSRALQAFLALIAGDLDRAYELGAEASRLAARKNTPLALALSAGLDSLLAATNGEDADALALAEKALKLSTQPGALELAEMGLALGACGEGKGAQALALVRRQWLVSVGMLKLPERSLLLLFLPVVAWLLSAADRPVRAVEILALGRAQPACPHGWWDGLPLLVGLQQRLAAELEPAAYAAAQTRGQAQPFATASTALLAELEGFEL